LARVIGFAVAALAGLVLTPLCSSVARRLGILDQPGGRKAHGRPTPLLGGVAVAAAATVGWLAVVEPESAMARVLLAAWPALVVGLLDDVRELPAHTKAAALAVTSGLVLVGLPGLALPRVTGVAPLDAGLALVFLWVVANAVNFADNMDGLCGLTVAGILAVVGLMAGTEDARALAWSTAGATLGFLPWNLSGRGRVFLGDAGSLFLGTVVGATALCVARENQDSGCPAMIPLLLCGVPLLDAATVTACRLLHRRPLVVGARDHLSHRLLALGLPERGVAVGLGVASAASALIAAAYVAQTDTGRLVIGGSVGLMAAVVVVAAVTVAAPTAGRDSPPAKEAAGPPPNDSAKPDEPSGAG
jgi:UDP-GlcNAc:undecaprenyl-phosphate GlcNAc-1-phosphate transferase